MYSSQCQNSKEEASSKEEEARLSPSVEADMEEAVIEGQVREVLKGGGQVLEQRKGVCFQQTHCQGLHQLFVTLSWDLRA